MDFVLMRQSAAGITLLACEGISNCKTPVRCGKPLGHFSSRLLHGAYTPGHQCGSDLAAGQDFERLLTGNRPIQNRRILMNLSKSDGHGSSLLSGGDCWQQAQPLHSTEFPESAITTRHRWPQFRDPSPPCEIERSATRWPNLRLLERGMRLEAARPSFLSGGSFPEATLESGSE